MLYYRKEISVFEYCKIRAYEIVDHIKSSGSVQVRYYNNRLVVFPFPTLPHRKYRGGLVGTYEGNVDPQWIIEDFGAYLQNK